MTDSLYAIGDDVPAPSDAKYDTERTAISRVAQFSSAAQETHEDYVKTATNCEDFFFGNQWREADLAEMRANRRPALTINMVLRAILAIYGEYSSMRATIGTKSRSNRAHDVSVTLNKVIEQSLYETDYTTQERDVFVEGLIGARGWLDIRIDDREDPLGAISITAKDPFHVVIPSAAKSYSPEEWPNIWSYDFYTRDEAEEEFGKELAEKIAYTETGTAPGSASTEGETDHEFGEGYSYEQDERKARAKIITEQEWQYRDAYVFIDPNTSDSERIWTTDIDSEGANNLAEENGLILEKRRLRHPRIYVYDSAGLMLKDAWSPYDYITLIPFFPYFLRGRAMGAVENLRSPQEQLNKAESQELHLVNTTSNGGWQMEEDSLVNMTPEELEQKGGKAGLVLVYRRGSKALDKINPNQIPTGVSNMGVKAAKNLIGVSAVNDGMLGITPQNVSGRVVDAKKQSGQAQLQMIFDNLELTRKMVGKAVLSLLQNFFTEERIVRMTSAEVPEGEAAEEIVINQATAAGAIVNDVTLGTYDIVVVTKPKQDVWQDYEFTELLMMREAGAQIPDWELINKSHLSDKKRIVAEMRRAAGLDLTDEEIQKAQLVDQIKIETLRQELLKKQAETARLMAEAKQREAEAQDLLIGQNRRFALGLMRDAESDQMQGNLRLGLAQLSADTQLAKQQIVNNNKLELEDRKMQQAELGMLMSLVSQAEPSPAPAKESLQEDKE